MDWDDYCYYTSRLSIDNQLWLRFLEFHSRHENYCNFLSKTIISTFESRTISY